MTCKICGKQLPEGSTTCKYCGARVKSGSAASKPASGTRKRYSKKGLARRRMINLILLLLALAIIAAVIAGIVWSANRIGDSARNDAPAASEPQTPETPEEPEAPADEAPIIPEEEQTEEPEQPAEEQQPEEEPAEEEPETPVTEEPAAEEPAAEEPAAPQPATDGYTISLNRTETTASLNHYRELEYYLSQELPAGVTVASTSWTSSNDAVVRAEEGRAWGVSLGDATVTVTVTLSNGHAMTAVCHVNVVESQIVTYSEYVLAESSTRLYSADELKNLTADELLIARNEIYARHGRMFSNPELQQYFNGKSWYSGTIAPENFDASVLNSYERANVKTILAVEASR